MNKLREQYPNIPALLEAIRERPSMFLGEQTIGGLSLLLHGISFAEDIYEIPKEFRLGDFDWADFEKWVESRCNLRRLSLNSFGLALHLAGSDLAGFDLWFRWYDEYGLNQNR